MVIAPTGRRVRGRGRTSLHQHRDQRSGTGACRPLLRPAPPCPRPEPRCGTMASGALRRRPSIARLSRVRVNTLGTALLDGSRVARPGVRHRNRNHLGAAGPQPPGPELWLTCTVPATRNAERRAHRRQRQAALRPRPSWRATSLRSPLHRRGGSSSMAGCADRHRLLVLRRACPRTCVRGEAPSQAAGARRRPAGHHPRACCTLTRRGRGSFGGTVASARGTSPTHGVVRTGYSRRPVNAVDVRPPFRRTGGRPVPACPCRGCRTARHHRCGAHG